MLNLNVTFSNLAIPAALGASLLAAGCASTGQAPAPTTSRDTPYRVAITPDIEVQKRYGTEVMRWGFNNRGYFTGKGEFAVTSGTEGCWETIKARVSNKATGTMQETTIAIGQWFNVPEWRCKAQGTILGGLTDAANSAVAATAGNGTRNITYRHEYFNAGSNLIHTQDFPAITVWKDTVDTASKFRRCFQQSHYGRRVGGSAEFLGARYPIMVDFGPVAEVECPKFQLWGAAHPASQARHMGLRRVN